MKPTHLRVALVAAAAMSFMPFVASAFDYNYVEGGYMHRDNDLSDEGGFRLAGAFDIAPNIGVFGEYGNVSSYDQFTAGLQFHTAIQNALDFTAGASVEHFTGSGDSNTGFGLRAGLRWDIVPGQWELNPEVRYIRIDGENLTSARLGGMYHINKNFAINAALQGGDDDRLEAGLRYSF